MGYVTVQFNIHEEDFRKGLLVRWLQVPGRGLVPFTWSHRGGTMIHHSAVEPVNINGRDMKGVLYELYGGTMEQFIHTADQQERYCEVHGWHYEGSIHFPRNT